ncbi:MAG: helix-turn-helix domain-containing protein [Bacteriovoracaceae bacterium]
MEKSIHEITDIHSQKNYYKREHMNAPQFFENLIWLSTEEAARLLRRSSHALRQLVYKGKIRPRKFGGRLYFKRSELNELIETSFY